MPESSESDAEKIRDKDFVFTGYTFKRFHPAEPGQWCPTMHVTAGERDLFFFF